MLENNDEIKKKLISTLRKESPNDNRYGGQMCGLPSNKVILISDDLNVRIEVGYHRSQIRNYEDARMLMELYIDDVVDKLYPKK
jgi:hypothetical protein